VKAETWRSAESAIGRPRAVERASSKIDDRLAWLLRAMQALDDGRIGEIQRVAAEATSAGHADVGDLLTLLVAAPDRIDPTRLRREAKARGAGRDVATFPWLDVYRMTAAWRTGEPTPRPSSLAKASRGRAALDNCTRLLGPPAEKRPKKVYHSVTPRASQVAWALGHLLRGHHLCDDVLQRAFRADKALALPDARWPDLHGGGLEAWAAGQGALTRERVDQIFAIEDLGQLRRVTNQMSPRILELIRSGRAALAIDAVGALSAMWVEFAPHAREAFQLEALSLRLSAIETAGSTVDNEALRLLWLDRERLRPAERVLLAERLLEEPEFGMSDEPEDIALVAQAYALLALAVASPQEALVRCRRAPFSRVARGLQVEANRLDAPAVRVQTVRSGLELYQGGPVRRAIATARELCTTDLPHAVALAETIAWLLPQLPEARREQARWTELLGLLAGRTLTCEQWSRLLFAGSVPDEVRASVRAACAVCPPDQLGHALGAAARAGLPDVVAETTTRIGRELRRLDRASGVERGLDYVTSVFVGPGLEPAVWEALRPIESFVLRDGGKAVAVEASRLDLRSPRLPDLMTWLLGARERPEVAPARRAALEMLVSSVSRPGPFVDMIVDVVERQAPASLEELMAAIATAKHDLESSPVPF